MSDAKLYEATIVTVNGLSITVQSHDRSDIISYMESLDHEGASDWKVKCITDPFDVWWERYNCYFKSAALAAYRKGQSDTSDAFQSILFDTNTTVATDGSEVRRTIFKDEPVKPFGPTVPHPDYPVDLKEAAEEAKEYLSKI